MNLPLAIIVHLITVAVMVPLRGVLFLIGLVVIPLALPYAYSVPGTDKRDEDGKLIWMERHLPRWAWLWDNDRDGTLGDKRGWWARERCGGWPGTRMNQFRWLALRNPIGNLRDVWPFDFTDDNPHIKHCVGQFRVNDDPGEGGWHFVWVGWRTGFYGIWEYGNGRGLEIRTGFKLRPVTEGKDIGFTTLIHPWRKI